MTARSEGRAGLSEEPSMPLLDHFNPPLNRTHPMAGFHGASAAAIARPLNQGVLPPGYYAVPLVDRDGPIESEASWPRLGDLSGRFGCRPD